MRTIAVVGMGMGPGQVGPQAREAVEAARVLAGGARLLAMFPDHPGQRLPLTGGLDAWLDQVADAARDRDVAVLASGDPGFYGILDRLGRRFGPDALRVIPGISTVQAAFARLGLAWQEARAISLHGRGLDALYPAASRHDLLAIYTDPRHHPAAIARALLARGQGGWEMFVLEDLGAPAERVGRHDLAAAAELECGPLNLVVLRRTVRPQPLHLGMAEAELDHQRGLITKREVRAAALAHLEILPHHVVWDLGAGSGSVGLEASLLAHQGQVWAVERDPARVGIIQANRARFGVAHLAVIQAALPQGLDQLPDPDRVFIGGGGAELPGILAAAWWRLRPGGRLVVSAVRLEALEATRQFLATAGVRAEVTSVQVSRGADLAAGLYLKALNPVWLVAAGKDPA